MDKKTFQTYIEEKRYVFDAIQADASILHDTTCNQKYDDKHPYSFHLNMVADLAMEYGHVVCDDKEHIVPIIFAAYFHDSIEDARLTYDKVLRTASEYMDKHQAMMSAEIVYALTNEKGRTRSERANDKYYEGIRNTKYAPFVKWCDRYANMKYSSDVGSHMTKMYEKELPSFLEKIGICEELAKKAYALSNQKNDR